MIATPVNLLILAAVVGLLVWVVVRLVRGGTSRRGRAVPGPVCGQCGYSTQGLTSLTCPECGGDFRLVGITTLRTPRRGVSFVPAAFMFTAMAALVAVPMTNVLVALVPPRIEYSQTNTLNGPPSKAYAGVTIQSQASGWGESVPAPAVDVALLPAPPAAGGGAGTAAATQPSANVPPLRVTARDPRGRPMLDPQSVLTWFGSAGIDTTNPLVASEATRIAAACRWVGAASSRLHGPGIGSWRSTRSGGDPMGVFNSVAANELVNRQPPGWAGVLLGAVWVAVWLLGLRLLRRVTPR